MSFPATRRRHRLINYCLCFLLAGCAANQAYHLGEAPLETAVTPAGSTAKDIYRLGFIEFDEQGDFWDRDELHKTVQAIRDTGRPVLLVTYIHGWQNNSNVKDADDVAQFRGLLARLTADQTVQQSGLQVFGVFLGWRGRVVHKVNPVVDAVTWLGKESSFYSRKNAATRISSSTPITEAIFTLIRTARRDTPGISRCIVIGHSFGALVLEKALSQALVGTLLYEPPFVAGGSKTLTSQVFKPADLILLVNSAAESIYSKELIDMYRDTTPLRGAPHVIMVSSDADQATSLAFPLGTKLSNTPKLIQGEFRDYHQPGHDTSQFNYFTQTPGHNDAVQSHRLVKVATGTTELDAEPFDLNLKNRPGSYEDVTLYTGTRQAWTQWRIERQGPNETNYWVLHVPKDIIAGHGPIFESASCQVMAALFRLAAAPDQAARSVQVKVKGAAPVRVEKTEQRVQQTSTGETIITPAQPRAGVTPTPGP
ncbi:MAG: hypothetical protein H0X40_12900 [Chthoniobacterales bacterium]|nr:hypothetical protein [Blastocatellia bacterium]MBA3962782.1 hypothetical protein [Chthoniobacterales bacterium]